MRADKFLADRFDSRTKAAETIEKGLVLVNGQKIRPKDEISSNDEITFVEQGRSFVSNGGYKLERAMEAFDYECSDGVFADIGASTGGFTDCLLQRGARKIFAIDVGESLLHESLKNDKRIVRMENTNARYLSKEHFDEQIDCVVTDVSFISLRLIFPAIAAILKENGDAFVLIKPQFECENKNISKNGIVKTAVHSQIVAKVLNYAKEQGLYPFGIVNAPIRKGKNVEYVLYVKNTYTKAQTSEQIVESVKALLKQLSNGSLL